ncbi:MAG: hypothetical protein M0024_01400 [Nitrospiraceae bacterium]|nr:hypothetical protein [Nitrospiraceae bacterium]
MIVTPAEQTALISALLTLLNKWPVWASILVVIVIGPWVAQGISLRIIERNQERRFNEVVSAMQLANKESEARYANNIKLVEFAEQIGKDYKELALMVNTALTTLTELIRNNLYCPLVRKSVQSETIEINQRRGE